MASFIANHAPPVLVVFASTYRSAEIASTNLARSVTMPQPKLVATVADQIDQWPVQYAPKVTKRRMVPGPDVSLQTRDPFPVRGPEMKPG